MNKEIIWAPWRLSYVTNDDEARKREDRENVKLAILPDGDANCFICQAAVAPDKTARYVVGTSEHTIAILNRYPYNNGHLLVAPKHHRPTLESLPQEVRAELMEQLTFWTGILDEVLHPEGFNIGLNLGRVAGAGLPGHLHWHIVPRWNGDTNFMAAVSDTKVIPQSLEALCDAIHEKIGKPT